MPMQAAVGARAMPGFPFQKPIAPLSPSGKGPICPSLLHPSWCRVAVTTTAFSRLCPLPPGPQPFAEEEAYGNQPHWRRFLVYSPTKTIWLPKCGPTPLAGGRATRMSIGHAGAESRRNRHSPISAAAPEEYATTMAAAANIRKNNNDPKTPRTRIYKLIIIASTFSLWPSTELRIVLP